MGNETSTQNNNGNSTNKMMEDLQKQILENQLEIQRIQINNLQNNNINSNNGNSNNGNKPSIDLNSIFNNKTLMLEISKKPYLKKQLYNKLLNEYNLTETDKNKIQSILNNLNLNNVEQLNQNKTFLATNIGTQKQNRSKYEIAQSRRQQTNNLQSLNQNYTTEEEEEEIRFRLEEEKRREQFREQQRQRRFEYEAKLKQLNNDNVNSLRLFQLNKNFTINQLKNAYKRVALQTHPDRPGGNKEKFQLVTKCYLALIEELKKREQDKSFDKLRDDSHNYYKERSKLNKKYKNNEKGLFNPKERNFNNKLFNKLFDENKLYDPNDEGYDDWLKNQSDDTPPPPKVFSDKFNINVFNSTFNGYKDTNPSTDIVEYKEPQALVSCNTMDHTDIDSKVKSDYTKAPEASNQLGYTDLKSAYTKTNNLINPNSVKIKQYRNVDEYEHERSNISFQMTPEQLREQAIQEQMEKDAEQERLERVRQRDYMAENHYNNMHQRMIGYQ